jgi:hypothetical protein
MRDSDRVIKDLGAVFVAYVKPEFPYLTHVQ